MRMFRKNRLLVNPEFQAALIRLGFWVFASIYIALGEASGRYQVADIHYYVLFSGYLIAFLGFLVSIYVRPVWEERRYLGLAIDISATTFCIYMTHVAVHPFYLIYIWIFFSYGTRYGTQFLKAASIMSVVAYASVVTVLEQWQQHGLEAMFYLLILVILPIYQRMLLRQLHRARQQAEQSSEVKSLFLSNVTHELRTPLRAIATMTQILEDSELRPEQRDCTESIGASTVVLDALIGDIIDFSRIESGGLEAEDMPFRLGPLLLEVCGAVMKEAQEGEVELVCRMEEQLPSLLIGDELRLRQVLLNLVGNAVRFADNGEVIVRARLAGADGEDLLLEVEDTGIGVSREKQDRVLDSFWKTDFSATDQSGDNGLGAAIIKKLVKSMGGEIGFRGSHNQGTLFWIRLPLRQAELTPEEPPYPRCDGKKALIYDANETSAEAIMESCRRMGLATVSVRKVADLAPAVAAAGEEGGVDLVIIGDSARRQDVVRIAEVVRGHLGAELPVVFLGYARKGLQLEKQKRVVFVKKPFLAEQLAQAVTQLLTGGRGKRAASSVARAMVSGPVSAGRTIRVLMAEDNLVNGKVLQTFLTGLGCEVTWVRDGREALRVSGERKFDLALTDLRMPHLDGLGFSRAYRDQEGAGCHLPIIALASGEEPGLQQVCRDAGMDDCLTKPIDLPALEVLLSRYVGAV